VYRILTHKVTNALLTPQERLSLVWNYIHAQSEVGHLLPIGQNHFKFHFFVGKEDFFFLAE
jgi:hypothetical protein